MAATDQIFNTRSRTDNVLMSSSVGTVAYLLSSVMGFVYRTVFIKILSANYLGINGLFSNILMLLSLTELGLGAAITYRFYKPIAENDVKKVGELMDFFKSVYRIVSAIIFFTGMSLYPFLDSLIADPSSVPSDVNLQIVYVLFVLQSVISYICVYRMSMWTADQKRYVCSIAFGVVDALRFGIQIVTLWLSRNFTLTVAVSIFVTLVSNIGLSIWTTRCYRPVFDVKTKLSRHERWLIIKDALALMCHRVGGVVVSSTDAIVLARFVSLAATGLFSNYVLLYKTLSMVFNQAFGEFTASFGNAYAKLSPDEYHIVFRRMQLVTLAASGLVSACFYFLLDDFVVLWIGKEMLLPHVTSAALAIQFYMVVSVSNVTSNLGATGLFVRDRIRSLIEAVLNLGTSIPLAIWWGVPGVVVGTIIGMGLTSFWRSPYILYRGAMKRSVWYYWRQYLSVTVFSVVVVSIAQLSWLLCKPAEMTWPLLLVKASLFSVFYLGLFSAAFWQKPETQYLIARVKRLVLEKCMGAKNAV